MIQKKLLSAILGGSTLAVGLPAAAQVAPVDHGGYHHELDADHALHHGQQAGEHAEFHGEQHAEHAEVHAWGQGWGPGHWLWHRRQARLHRLQHASQGARHARFHQGTAVEHGVYHGAHLAPPPQPVAPGYYVVPPAAAGYGGLRYGVKFRVNLGR